MPHLIFCGRRIMSLILPLPLRYLLSPLFRRPCTRDRVFQYYFVLLLLFRTDNFMEGIYTMPAPTRIPRRATQSTCPKDIVDTCRTSFEGCNTRCCYNYEKGYRCRSYHSIHFINKELIFVYFEFTSKLSLSYSSIH